MPCGVPGPRPPGTSPTCGRRERRVHYDGVANACPPEEDCRDVRRQTPTSGTSPRIESLKRQQAQPTFVDLVRINVGTSQPCQDRNVARAGQQALLDCACAGVGVVGTEQLRQLFGSAALPSYPTRCGPGQISFIVASQAEGCLDPAGERVLDELVEGSRHILGGRESRSSSPTARNERSNT